MPLPAWLIPAGLSALGLIGGGAKSESNQTQTTTNQLDPAYGPLQSLLLKQTMARLNQPQAMSQSQIASGVGAINDTYRTAQQGIQNRAASMGQSGGAGELYALGNADMARAGDIGQYRAVTVPGIERDWSNQDLALGQGILGQGRYSTTTTGTSTQGGGVAGALGGLGGMLGFLYGQKGLPGMGGGGSPNLGAIGGGAVGGTGGFDWSSLFKMYSGSQY